MDEYHLGQSSNYFVHPSSLFHCSISLLFLPPHSLGIRTWDWWNWEPIWEEGRLARKRRRNYIPTTHFILQFNWKTRAKRRWRIGLFLNFIPGIHRIGDLHILHWFLHSPKAEIFTTREGERWKVHVPQDGIGLPLTETEEDHSKKDGPSDGQDDENRNEHEEEPIGARRLITFSSWNGDYFVSTALPIEIRWATTRSGGSIGMASCSIQTISLGVVDGRFWHFLLALFPCMVICPTA